jgi:putative DNA primase/helicase
VFIPNLKLEKALFLYGSGANGKSVFFDIVTALFGKENIINNSLSSLCERDDYRAKLANKLVNYASEVGTKINSDIFKQMASNETLTVRKLYGEPYEITNYARLIFNANTLPKDTEQTNAYFRRFLIIPFDVTISESRQNPNLAKEIIMDELAGVFNWALEGLDRLVQNQRFSPCRRSDDVREQYQLESDSVAMFLNENDYQKSNAETKLLKDLHQEYKAYCFDSGYRACSNRTFAERLRIQGYIIRKTMGNNVIEIKTIETDNAPY